MSKKVLSGHMTNNSPKNKQRKSIKPLLCLMMVCGALISTHGFAQINQSTIGKPVSPFDNPDFLSELSLINDENINTNIDKDTGTNTEIDNQDMLTKSMMIILETDTLALNNHTIKIDKAKITKFSHHPTWRRLLHYRDGEKISSAKMKPDFFVSKDGASNPSAEMKSMLEILQTSDSNNSHDDSVQCRFPARTHWLNQQFELNIPQADCPIFNTWMRKYHPKQLAVAFVQEYPDRPSSAFAHTLLQIQSKNNQKYAVNYTVAGDPTANEIVYFVKSSTGKYDGLMTIENYDNKVKKYLSKDMRDIWTYTINLSQAEQEQVVRHIWEVKDLGLPYYFLSDNCSSEILRLVDIVRPKGSLYAQTSTFVIPSEIIRIMDDKGLLLNKEYSPSDANVNESIRQAKNNPTTAKYKQPLTDPTLAHNLKRATVSIGRAGDSDYVEIGGRVTYRDLLDSPLGNRQNMDMQTLDVAIRAYADSENSDKAIQLQKLTLLAGRSYNPVNTARKGGSWGVDLSAKQVNDASADFSRIDEDIAHDKAIDQQHLVGNIGFQKGVSYAFGTPQSDYDLPSQLCYGFGGGDVQFSRAITNGYRLGVSADVGCVVHLADKLRAKAEVSLPYWYHGDTSLDGHIGGYWQPIASLGMQYDIAKNHGIRLTAEHELSDRVHADTDVQLGWQWYF